MPAKTFANHNLKNSIIYDLFTGLYTKAYFKQTVEKILSENKSENYVLMVVTINNLKQIKDNYDHKAVNRIILDISNHLQKFPYISSYSHNEFLLLIPCPTNAKQLDKLIYEILDIQFSALSAGLSFGKSLFPKQHTSYKDLLVEAVHSLQKAKECKQ